MRVAHVIRSDSFAGVERYVAMVATRLGQRGCDVTVIGGDPARMKRSCPNVAFQGAASTADVVRALLRCGPFDLVHAHMTAAEAAAVVTRAKHRAHIVSTLHFAHPRGHGFSGRLLRSIGRLIDQEIAISEFVAAHTGSSMVLANGVERARPANSVLARSVLVMQRWEPEKETMLALEAWARSTLRIQGWRLLLAGRGSEESALRAKSRRLGIDGTVNWVGYVEDTDELLRRSAALLATAPAEPFGLSVAEAMARAIPVIASDGGAHPELLGESGWYFESGSVEGCARALDLLPTSDVSGYGEILQRRQRALFDIDDHVGRLVDIYNEVCGGDS